nr:hypothetical protein [Escherichia coli]
MGSCAAPSAKGDDKFITTDYLQQCLLVGLITSVARIRSGGLLLPVLLHMEATTLGLLFG